MMRYGEYANKKARDQYGRELRKAHFQLGSKAADTVTTYKTDYLPYELANGANGANGVKETKESKGGNDGGGLRASHFALGVSADKGNSSYSQDYPAKTADKVALSHHALADIRATHYALGHTRTDYCSIQRRDYAAPQPTANRAADSKDTTANMRKHSHSFGTTVVPYQSVNAMAYAGQSQLQYKEDPRPA